MINHVRTLLLNRPAEFFTDVPGSQYIDPSFRPVVLSATLLRFYRTFMPAGIDPMSENMVAAAIMKILHCPELVDYTLGLDPRVTYGSSDDPAQLLNPAVYRTFTKFGSCDMDVEYTIVAAAMPNTLGTAGVQEWIITPEDSKTILIQSSRSGDRLMNVIDPLSTTRSKVVELIPGYLSFRFVLPSAKLTGNFKLNLSTMLPVPYNIADYNNAITTLLAQPLYMDAISKASAPNVVAFQTLRSNWLNTSELTIKFGSAILAYVYQLNALFKLIPNIRYMASPIVTLTTIVR